MKTISTQTATVYVVIALAVGMAAGYYLLPKLLTKMQ